MVQDTIYALSSGQGTAGVAVVRISGDHAFSALDSLVQGKDIKPRYATLVTLKDPVSGMRLDQALVLTFPGPNSFTGENVVELHLHGGKAVVTGVLDCLSSMSGLRLAERGEFTRRAFENGKLDLTEAEGLNDLIHADTAMQREQALRQMGGELRHLYEDWRSRLLSHLAHLEADIDFPDEDLPEGVAGAVRPVIRSLLSEIETHLSDGKRGQALRDGLRIVILGEPNAGKSTLLNFLAKSDVAIVSDEAGTTRDVLEVQLDLGGFPVRLIDTAGIRESSGSVEKEGIRRAKARAEEADLKLILIPAPTWPKIPEDMKPFLDDTAIILVSQCDKAEMFHVEQSDTSVLPLSVKTGFGMEAFLAHLTHLVEDKISLTEAPSLTRLRHRLALEDVVGHLNRFQENAGFDAVLAAEDVRMACRSLGKITGRVGVEVMLDIVFSDFCIGK
ncbi:tRNA modification GTPase MnmE [Kordiimonas sediminis]|uniref:tRNA modification GTPase MnmE n=1 Tax=Kordiimonas sediminis TaxID=1735581 RepID=A0A919AMW2_9PROT|nr:tRNA uridine-5-carboxymethylaminomethyl(34) synthesis GTPase MnmE [Kordiimonas sediminis]GHF15567.1 tRNA modification GTPase MnmE [Kordiimonas sediminis]